MSKLCWQLPGPNSYVARVVEDLRRGKNVILALPEHAPDGLYSEIKGKIGYAGTVEKLPVPLDNREEPVNYLYGRYLPAETSSLERSTYSLSSEEGFNGKIIWIEVYQPDIWLIWKDFLTDYAHACRSCDEVSRTVFCVSLSGSVALQLPNEDVCLACHKWCGTVSHLDMLFYTSHLFERRSFKELTKNLTINIVSHLAQWDFSLSERLAAESFENILNPLPVLKEFAAERNWDSLDVGNSFELQWCYGLKNRFSNTERAHAAAMCFQNNEEALDNLIWQAEIKVMFPYIEERRRDLIKQFERILSVPYQLKPDFPIVNRLRDLELNHIYSQIYPLLVSEATKDEVLWLKTMRNHLAHLETLPIDLILQFIR